MAALHSAGGACRAVDALMEGSAGFAASVHRPPGHHAEVAQAMGFCLLNNVAIAAAHARAAHEVERVLILDWDVHHGNGTNAIFHASPDVLFASIHEWPLYPGTGAGERHGQRAGARVLGEPAGPGGVGGRGVRLARLGCGGAGGAFVRAGAVLLVSAGFDAHADDPLADCRVTDAGFAAMAAAVRALGAELGVPAGLVLEGGYDLGALSRSLCDVLSVFAADEAPAVAAVP